MLKSLSTSLILRGVLAMRRWDPGAGLAWGHGLRAGHFVRRVRVRRRRPANRPRVQQRHGWTGLRSSAVRPGEPGRRGDRSCVAVADTVRAGADRRHLGGDKRSASRSCPASEPGRPRDSGRCSSSVAWSSIVFGVVLLARPGMGAVALALVFGLFNLICGAWMLVHRASSCVGPARACIPSSATRRRLDLMAPSLA